MGKEVEGMFAATGVMMAAVMLAAGARAEGWAGGRGEGEGRGGARVKGRGAVGRAYTYVCVCLSVCECTCFMRCHAPCWPAIAALQ